MRNLLMLSVAVCIGCTPVFVKPANVSDQQFAQDTYRCQLEARHEAPQPPPGPTQGLDDAASAQSSVGAREDCSAWSITRGGRPVSSRDVCGVLPFTTRV